MKMTRPNQRCKKLKCWYGIPVSIVRRFSRVARRTVKGVRAYERIPTRLDHHPNAVLVLLVCGCGGSHRFQMIPVNLLRDGSITGM
jgi:hypothetical protein